MSYHWDFTIGKRETLDFYLSLVLRRWRGGIAGFGAVGALASLLYSIQTGVSLPAQVGLAAVGAAAFALLVTLWLVLSTHLKVKEQLRRSGRESYIQEIEISGFGIRVTVGKDKARLAFENLAQVRETGKAFYLFLSGAHAWILPKAQMEDPEEESAQLRKLFTTVLERKKLHLKR